LRLPFQGDHYQLRLLSIQRRQMISSAIAYIVFTR
jgi:hypothetical protein